MSEIYKVEGNTPIDPNRIKPGTIIDYGTGQLGLVVDPVHATPEAMGRVGEIASGFSGSRALYGDSIEEAYQSFYQDPSMGRLASKAASLSRREPFNMTFFEDEIALSTAYENDPNEAMRLAEKFYRTDSIAGRVIELMAQFSIAGMRHQVNDPNVKQFFDEWSYQVGFIPTLHRVFLNYYLYGNVYTLKTLVNFKQGPVDPNFKFHVDPDLSSQASMTPKDKRVLAKANERYQSAFASYMAGNLDVMDMIDIRDNCYEQVFAARKNVWSKSMIPGNFTILDPKAIKLYGPGDFGLGIMTYTVSYELKKMVTDPASVVQGVQVNAAQLAYQKRLLLQIPKDILSQIKGGAREIVLDPNYVSSIHRMKLDFENLGFPLMTRAFKALHMKNRLREMDNALINNLIGQMVIVKVGSDKFPAKPAQMQALSDAYKEAVQSKSLVLFWNHTIEVERVPVELDVLGAEKYEVWNNDIRDAFGISPLLLGRNEGSSGSAFMSVKGFLENLQQGRDDVLNQFVYPEYHGIAVAMGFPGFPEVVFDRFKLDDEASAINTLVKLVQAGIIDYQTAVEDLGYDWAQTLQRHTEQAPLKDDGIIRIAAPYQDPEAQAPAAGTSPTEGGRPGGDGQKGGQPNSRPKSKNANPQKKVV